MDIRWSYYLIFGIYIVLIILAVLNHKTHQQFKEGHSDTQTYAVTKHDFFTTVALACIVMTIGINGAALIFNRPMVWSSIIITILVIGMTTLTAHIEVVTSLEGVIVIDGTEIKNDNGKEVCIKEKKNKTLYQIQFEQPINGYEAIDFMVSGPKKDTFTTFIKAF